MFESLKSWRQKMCHQQWAMKSTYNAGECFFLLVAISIGFKVSIAQSEQNLSNNSSLKSRRSKIYFSCFPRVLLHLAVDWISFPRDDCDKGASGPSCLPCAKTSWIFIAIGRPQTIDASLIDDHSYVHNDSYMSDMMPVYAWLCTCK